MTDRARAITSVAALVVVASALLAAALDLAATRTDVVPYGTLLVDLTVQGERGVNAVSAVLFDLRPSDTLGEALALFVASAGLQVVLRGVGGERRRDVPLASAPTRTIPAPSETIRAVALGFVAPTAALAVFVTVRGHVSVGGGLQGGTLAATALALLFLAGRYRAQRSIATEPVLDVGEAVSLGGYVVLGLAGLVVGAAFLENVLPLGEVGALLSAGTIPVLSILVAVEAAAAVLLVISEVQEEPLEREGRP